MAAPITISQDLLDRLVCAKYLVQVGEEHLDHHAPYSAGLAVLAFHDAVELFLRTAAELHRAPIKEPIAFNQLLDTVESAIGAKLSHRSALLQLNGARTNFKHRALAPRDEDARKFRTDLAGFLTVFMRIAFHIYLEDVSAASLVRHTRTANWLRVAEKHLADGAYAESVRASAIAYAVFRTRHRKYESKGQEFKSVLRASEPRSARSGGAVHRGVYEFADAVEERFRLIEGYVELLSTGVDYREFQRFIDTAPIVTLMAAGTLHIVSRTDTYTLEEAVFCAGFALRIILNGQHHSANDVKRDWSAMPSFKVIKSCDILVWPDDVSGEVIRVAAEGETLVAANNRDDKPGFQAVLQDESAAWVRSNCLVSAS